MNLILFEEPFERIRLAADDPRAKHMRDVLRAGTGDLVFVGFVEGPRARVRVSECGGGSLDLEVLGSEKAPPVLPVGLLVGLPRPHTARRILFDSASMGVDEVHFFPAEKSQPSYAQSRLWKTGEWRERLWLGAEQGFTTHLPAVIHHPDLASAIGVFSEDRQRIVLDNYEAGASVGGVLSGAASSVVLALGPEGGWSSGERAAFGAAGWKVAHLGPHVLRTETACIAAVSAAAEKMGLWAGPTVTRLAAKPSPEAG